MINRAGLQLEDALSCTNGDRKCGAARQIFEEEEKMSNGTTELIHPKPTERVCVCMCMCEVMTTGGMCWRGILALYSMYYSHNV